METTQRYDRRSIMRNAWRHYRRCFNITFGDALRWAWNLAKEERRNKEYNRKKREGYLKRYGKADSENRRLYAGVVFGKTDYAVSYGKKYR